MTSKIIFHQDGHSGLELPDLISNSEVKQANVPCGTALLSGKLGRLSTFHIKMIQELDADGTERIVFTEWYNGRKFVLEGVRCRGPDRVIGELVERLGLNYMGNSKNVVMLRMGTAGEFVRVRPIPASLEKEILHRYDIK